MQLSEARVNELREWVIKRLENISDADPDVLADYVLALLRSDVPDDAIQKSAVDNLEDFLKDHTQNFVDELFSKFAPESTAAATPATTIPPPLNIPGLDAAVGPAGNSQPIEAYDPTTPLDLSNKTTNGFNKSRKRSYNDRFGPVNGQDPQHAGSSRAPKVHRGSRGGRDDPNNGRNSHIVPPAPQRTKFSHNPTLAGMPSPPTPPPGFPSFNPNDPIGAMLAMQAMFPQMSGGKAINSPLPPKVNQRCKDYDVKGFCVMGSACPYDHGNDPVVASSKAEEYDPNNASISPRLTVNGHRGRGASARNRGLDRGARGKGDQNSLSPRYDSRASFSDPKPNFDRSNTTVVVEQIPEENFEEGSVREFFSQYGSVKEVTMRPYKRLAIVQYRDYISARRAYDSPKVIFDNRFVKVYWYKSSEDKKINGTALRKSTSGPRLSSAKQSQTSPDEPSEQANVLSQQAEAQKNYETKAKARKEMSEAKAALIRKQEEITKKADNERAELLAKIAAKEGKKPDAELPKAAATNDAKAAQDEEVNRALREQLAKLEAEAKSLGIDPNAPHDEPYPSYGGYRGRGGARQFSSRGRGGFRGNSSYRGSWTSTRGGSSVRRLDNRPKRVAVSGVEWTPEKDECLREHLVGIVQFESIDQNPERSDSLIVSFKERYMAEILMHRKPEIPGIGSVELSWVAGPPPLNSSHTRHRSDGDVTMKGGDSEDGRALRDIAGGDTSDGETGTGEKETGQDVEYDVAEENDWGIVE